MNDKNDEYIVDIKNLHKRFDDRIVLDNVSLRVAHGENVAVVGRSGVGKSVLLKCMVRLLKPEVDKMTILGQNVPVLNKNDLNHLRQRIGFLFQGGALYDSMTVRDNLSFPVRRTLISKNKQEVNRMVEEALDHVELLDAIDKYPEELSGGMKKRVGLARTLILNPDIILYDEPTTGLDPITSRNISNLILRIQKEFQTTSIIVTHDLTCTKITANNIVVLQDGRFIEKGTFDDMKNSDQEFVRDFFQ
ncbi:MAG: ATP-binding cassette domain-containing protein [Bacteroidales bacterium]|nr:ATP-binding cassette domain-containing protein [Bacteroidales bacterium]